jgi:hypothetical protein
MTSTKNGDICARGVAAAALFHGPKKSTFYVQHSDSPKISNLTGVSGRKPARPLCATTVPPFDLVVMDLPIRRADNTPSSPSPLIHARSSVSDGNRSVKSMASSRSGLADFLTGVYPDRMEARAEGQNVGIRLISSG